MIHMHFYRILGRDCNAELLQHHFFAGSHEDMVVSQSKDAIIYVTVSLRIFLKNAKSY